MSWFHRNTYGLVAFLVVVVAADWMVVARTAWLPSMVGLSVSVGLGPAALRSIDVDVDSAVRASREVRVRPTSK